MKSDCREITENQLKTDKMAAAIKTVKLDDPSIEMKLWLTES